LGELIMRAWSRRHGWATVAAMFFGTWVPFDRALALVGSTGFRAVNV
jgi:nucleoside-diphosphate-sugar epimerase